jgi:pSer/pThr/pTyr-binding forkhead associated (FHA) protein
MASQRTSRQSAAPKRSARDLIDAVIENMRANLEPLKYSTLVPSRYVVYLHPEEFSRIEPIVPVLQEQTVRALGEELLKLNSRPAYRKYLDRFTGGEPPVENAGQQWRIEFLPDADGELNQGDILVHSELMLPPGGEVLGAGQRTRRITTIQVGQRTTKREDTIEQPDSSAAGVHARLRYQDNAGPHTFDVRRDSTTIGRGGVAYRADLRLDTSVDVSREHARIRRDPKSGRFFIIDLSTLGTTLNGQRLPKGFVDDDSGKRENGVETPISNGARIGLADTVFLDFEIVLPS